ncbi:MAG TPA: IS200/IS605 family transposase [Longimicrobium sp.]|nr:IS200/IS605 family transposase [Longimicrobium sp.]
MKTRQRQHQVRLRAACADCSPPPLASSGLVTMRSPWTQLFLHLVWSTWDRLALLTEPLRSEVYDLIQAECTRSRSDLIAIGGIEDHVHLLVRVPASITPADLVKQVKGVSSHAINHASGTHRVFKWQGAHGAFSVSKRHIPMVENYVLNQEEHHRSQTIYPLLEPPELGATPDRPLGADACAQSAKADFVPLLPRIHSPSEAGHHSPAPPHRDKND